MMPTSLSRHAVLLVLASLTGLAAACGDDGSGDMMVAPPPPRAPEVAEVAAEAAAAAETETPSASLITEIDRRSFNSAARDPFTPRAPQRREEQIVLQPECDVEVDPLGETALTDVELVGLVTGTPVPRAMFTVIGETEALFLTEGAKIGPNCSFRIIEIRENEVVVEQLTSIESDRTQTILPLNPERVEAEVFANR